MNYNLSWQHEPENWGDDFTPQFICAWMDCRERVMWLFRWWLTTGVCNYRNLTSSDIFSEIRTFMPRKKGNSNVNDNGNGNSRSSTLRGNEPVWLNIPLDDQDAIDLEQSDTTFEHMAANLVSLAADGYGVSIKLVDKGESYCVTLIRPDPDDPRIAYGMSSFGGELRDALLSCMLKLDRYVGFQFEHAADFVKTNQQKRRFR